MTQMNTDREVWIDWLRIIACFFVMMTHCCEGFYFGDGGTLVLTKVDAFWVTLLNTFTRACVPLFVVASSYLQFPIHYPAGTFFRRRGVRVLVPFVIWSLVYALVWGDPVQNFKDLLLNFNYSAGHLWFVYMILGVYLIMPLLSPWAEKVGKKELQLFLGIWLFTTVIPYIRYWAGGPAEVIYGPSGIPNLARYPLWGEASWNAYGTFYYFSGFIGYLLLGLYFRKFVKELSWKKTLAIALPLFAAGFAIGAVGFYRRVLASAGGVFPVSGPVGYAAIWETTWFNDTLGLALMTIAWILIIRKMNGAGPFYKKFILPVSQASYGMYLCHMLVLSSVLTWICAWLKRGTEGVLGFWTTPVEVLLTALITFIVTAVLCVLVRRIPKVGKFIMG